MLASYALDYDARACSEHKTKSCLGHNRSFCEALLNFNPTMPGAAQHNTQFIGEDCWPSSSAFAGCNSKKRICTGMNTYQPRMQHGISLLIKWQAFWLTGQHCLT